MCICVLHAEVCGLEISKAGDRIDLKVNTQQVRVCKKKERGFFLANVFDVDFF